jgi:glycerophosphoryl diester phosphodiesterase
MAGVLFIHHAATLGGRFPPSSLSGLAACLAAGASIVEMDIVPLADGEFALLHDGRLESCTDGAGPVAAATSEQLRALRLCWRGALSAEPAGTLTEAVALVAAHPGLAELQLDLKPHAPLTETVLADLVRRIATIRRRVRVTSMADWALRRLHLLDAGLALGFDPFLYLDVERPREAGGQAGPRVPPHHAGAYGYLDDHPLAADRWGSAREYLAARVEVLAAQGTAGIWYVRAALLARMLEDGFDWIAWLHLHGIQVCAWTLDPGQPHHVALARRLIRLGVDRITTDDPAGLAAAVG